MDLLQLVVSLVFTRFLNIFKAAIPYESGFLPADIALLVVAIILTGVGAAMTVDMQLVPNPGDGIVHSLAQRFGKELGLCKNLFDVGCVAISLVLGLAFGTLCWASAWAPSSPWWGWAVPSRCSTACANPDCWPWPGCSPPLPDSSRLKHAEGFPSACFLCPESPLRLPNSESVVRQTDFCPTNR